MTESVGLVVSSYRKTHRLAVKLVEDLSNEQLSYQPNPTTPPIAFHMWHLARYADSFPDQAGFDGGMLWQAESLAERWGLSPESLGIYESGTGMQAGVAGQLQWPRKAELLDYARRAFAAADEMVGLLDEVALERAAKWGGRTIGVALMSNLEHDNRHLGMIEGLRGMLGLQGSATG